ncbi:MAG: hypothetical protein LBH01_03990 [Verrucomicrobiales bacterium]|jgi:hypothetical protein|nr:hypothetical protein [Verrucomicrobiales bacterium]
METLAEKIRRAKAENPQEKPIPENSLKVEGYWEKDNKEGSSWVAEVIGVRAQDSDMVLDLRFVENHSIRWTSKKKEKTPAGIKTWYLPDGVYKARLVEKNGAEPAWHHFAVVDGVRDELTENQVFGIFTDPLTPTPEEMNHHE